MVAVAALDHAVDEDDQRDDRQQHAERVQPTRFRILGLGDQEVDGDERDRSTIGTLTRKIDPHQKYLSKMPPVIGPRAIAMPEAPAQMPIAFGRSRGSNTFWMIDSVCGWTAAAPIPIRARNSDELSSAELGEGADRGHQAEQEQADQQDPLAARADRPAPPR